MLNHQQKRELQLKRKGILEDIGEDLLRRGALPPEFQGLPEEFEEIDVLAALSDQQKQKLTDQLADLDAHIVECQDRIRVLDRKRKNEIDPVAAERDRLNQSIKAEHGTLPGVPGQSTAMSQLKELNLKLVAIKESYAESRSKVKEELETYQRLRDGLSAKIGQLDDEVQQLRARKNNRCVELGAHAREHGIDVTRYGEYYQELESLEHQLAELAPSPPAEEKHSTANPSWNLKWVFLPLGVVVIGLLIALIFRGGFSQRQLPFLSLAREFPAMDGEVRLFWDCDLGLDDIFGSQLPAWSDVPGGDVFAHVEVSDLARLLISRTDASDVRLLGLGLRQPKSDFSQALTQAGWMPQSVPGGLRALTDGVWSWIEFDDTQFLLMPKDDSSWIADHLEARASDVRLFCQRPIAPLNANYPVLQGLNEWTYQLEGDQAEVILKASEPLIDFSLRSQYLSAMLERIEGGQVSFSLSPQQLIVRGPRAQLVPPPLEEAAVVAFAASLEQLISAAAARAPQDGAPFWASHDPIGFDALPEIPSSDQQALIAFRQIGFDLELRYAAQLGRALRDVVCGPHSNRLVLSDSTEAALIALCFREDVFVLEKLVHFNDGPDGSVNEKLRAQLSGFAPGLLSFSPDGRYLAVLEWNPGDELIGRLVLCRGDDLEPIWAGAVPQDCRQPLCCTWNAEGTRLFVGVAGSRGRGVAQAVLAYHVEADGLVIDRTMGLPADGRSGVEIGAVAVDETQNRLYAVNLDEGSLARYDLDRSTEMPLDRTLLSQLSEMDTSRWMVFHIDGHGLTLDRTGKLALILDRTDFSHRQYGSKVFIADLDAPRPVTLDVVSTRGMPFSTLRLPLTNKFWVSESNRQSLLGLQIEAGNLKTRAQIELGDFSPQHMACSQWGDFLFVAGQTPSQSSR